MNQVSSFNTSNQTLKSSSASPRVPVSRLRIVAVILFLGLATTTAVAWTIGNQMYHEVRTEIAKENQVRASQIQGELQNAVLLARALSTHSSVARSESRDSLIYFLSRMGTRAAGLEALGWAPATVSTTSSSDYPAHKGFPIAEQVSWGDTPDITGIDFISDAISGGAWARELFLPLEVAVTDEDKRFLFAVPVYSWQQDIDQEAGATTSPMGYATAVLNITTTIENVISQRPVSGFHFEVYENRSNGLPPRQIYRHESRSGSFISPTFLSDQMAEHVLDTSRITFVDRIWQVEARPSSSFIAHRIAKPILLVVLAGLLITLSITWYVNRAINEGIRLHRLNDRLLARETELRQKTALVRGIFQDVPDSMVLTDENRRIVMLNPSAEREFGYATDELIGRETKMILARIQDFHDLEKRKFNPDASSDTTPSKVEYRRRDGSTFIGELVGTPIRDDNGEVISYLGVIRNVSERIRLERELEENREFLRVILDSIENGIVACDGEGTLKLFNRATTEFHGLPARELPPEEWSKYYNLFHEDGETPMEVEDIPLFRALRGDHVKDTEMVIKTRDGMMRRLVASGQSMTGRDGRCIGAVVSMNDVTRQHEAEEALRQSQRLEAIGKLTGGVAHDFNNLLGIVLGNLQFLERSVGDDETAAKRISGAIGATKRGAQLTRRLLSFSRQDAFSGEVTDINETIDEFQDMLARTLTSEISVEFHPGDDLWLTEIDPGDLCDAVLNLALNARDAMPNGGRLVVETRNQSFGSNQSRLDLAPGEYVVLSVSDTGTGISPDVLKRVFEPFFTTKETGKGTGLGLSMVYGFVKRSRGDIRIYSEMGHGTTVRLFLPRATATPALAPAPEKEKEAPRGGDETILVVDDEPELLELASNMLSGLGYRVLEAGDGPSAMRMLERHGDIDMVLSDVIMPGGMDGFQVARQARELRPDMKIILASGFTGRTAGQDADPDFKMNMVTKPYGMEALASAVRSCLDGRESNVRAFQRSA